MERIMTKERFVAKFLADQAARKNAKADWTASMEISKESLRMLRDMEDRMGMDREIAAYAAEMHRKLNAKKARNRALKKRRPRRK